MALAALIQCLIVRLGELYDCGEFLPLRRQWIVAENKWRAARYADEAMIIKDDAGTLEKLDENTHAIIERVEPISKRLNCHRELLDVRRLLEVRPSFHRLREIFKETGSSKAVVDHLVRQLIENDPF
jgi:carboxylate-amine ligase